MYYVESFVCTEQQKRKAINNVEGREVILGIFPESFLIMKSFQKLKQYNKTINHLFVCPVIIYLMLRLIFNAIINFNPELTFNLWINFNPELNFIRKLILILRSILVFKIILS